MKKAQYSIDPSYIIPLDGSPAYTSFSVVAPNGRRLAKCPSHSAAKLVCSALNAKAATQPSWRPAAATGYAKEVSAH